MIRFDSTRTLKFSFAILLLLGMADLVVIHVWVLPAVLADYPTTYFTEMAKMAPFLRKTVDAHSSAPRQSVARVADKDPVGHADTLGVASTSPPDVIMHQPATESVVLSKAEVRLLGPVPDEISNPEESVRVSTSAQKYMPTSEKTVSTADLAPKFLLAPEVVPTPSDSDHQSDTESVVYPTAKTRVDSHVVMTGSKPQSPPAVVTSLLDSASRPKVGVQRIESVPMSTVAHKNHLQTESQAMLDWPKGEVKRIHFSAGSSVLSAESREILHKVANYLVSHPNTHVVLEGHTDIRGTENYNQWLSGRRSSSVQDYLIAQKSAIKARIRTTHFGETKPLVEKWGHAAWAENRRVDVKIDTTLGGR